MKTILITGCSSGFGVEIARFFVEKGWRVVATMRTPRADILPVSDNLTVVKLDVRDPASIRAALDQAGPIDVLVNNAGIGWMNVVEGTPADTLRDLFETNTFGTIAMMQAVLPQFRERREGVIVNVSSGVTLKPLPLLAAYTASKAAVNAFTESAAIELAPYGIRLRLVLPGRAPDTSFSRTARGRLQDEGGFPAPYADFVKEIFGARERQGDGLVTHPSDVVAAVWRAATDPSSPMRIPAGADAVALAA
ncbi:SDR family oxidoreductase [Pseudorhizobium sp. NPDC055634]